MLFCVLSTCFVDILGRLPKNPVFLQSRESHHDCPSRVNQMGIWSMYFSLIIGPSNSAERRCSEQSSIRGKRKSERPGLRLRGGHFLLAKPGFSATNAAGCGPGRDPPLHPDAARPCNNTSPTTSWLRWQIFFPPKQCLPVSPFCPFYQCNSGLLT